MPLQACTADAKYQKLPVVKTFELHKENAKTELLMHISQEDNYAFSLLFKYKYKYQEDRARVSALMRGKDTNGRETNGEKTPIGVEFYTIKDGQNILVSLGGAESMPLFSWGGGDFEKLIYTDYLMLGDYRVVVETKAGNPKFKDVNVEVHVGKAHKPK